MKKNLPWFIYSLLAVILPTTLFAQAPAIQWNKLLGGTHYEVTGFTFIKQTSDGGFIMTASTDSRDGDIGDASHPDYGSNYYWIVKMDAAGNKQWDKLYGGSGFQNANAIWQTTDGGYIISGQSNSSQSGDVSGVNHKLFGSLNSDYWILKLDASGNKVWDKLLGSTQDELNNSIQQTKDGGFIISGWSFSGGTLTTDGDITGTYRGDADFWIVKLDGAGNKVWDKLLGGSASDFAPFIQQTADGNYIIAGTSSSSQSHDVSGINHGGADFWVVKLDAAGNKLWDKLLGGAGEERPFSIQQTQEGGYIVTGSSKSSQSGDVSSINHGSSDFWIVKLDAQGNKTWDKLLGTVDYEAAYAIQQTSDGGYQIAGVSGPDQFSNRNDIWLVKLNAAGNTMWEKLYGGGNEYSPTMQLTSDGGIIVGCNSNSSNTGDVTGISHGAPDIWVAKFAPATVTAQTGSGTGLKGTYYNGTDLTGTPLLSRLDTTINFLLTYGSQPQVLSPAPGIVPDDKFSVRWAGQVQPQYSETYTFSTVSDDGIRLWVNGVQLVDNWVNQSATEKSGTISLVAGQKYDIVVEYYENTGDAVAQLYWSSPSTPKTIVPKSQLYPIISLAAGTGLQGVYYKGITLSGLPLLSRVDTTINFELTYYSQPQVLSPAPGIVPDDKYSVRWTGQVQPQFSETYTFYTASDDGIRLWVNGVQLVDNWMTQNVIEKNGNITLEAGQKYDIVIEYYENTGDAITKLSWSSASTPKAIIPKSRLYPVVRGLQGVYYQGTELAGAPLLTRIDSTINFELTYGSQPQVLSPAPGIVPEDKFSVRWTGQVQAQYSETYTFYTKSDDGIRLWVNGIQLVDNWMNQDATEKSGSISLVAGQKYDIVIEYYENTGNAVAQLYWSSASTPRAIVPQIQLFPTTAASGARIMADQPVASTTTLCVVPLPIQPVSIYPNPVLSGKPAKLVIYSENNAPGMLTINGVNGQTLRAVKLNLVPGINTINVNTGGLARGLYFVTVTGNSPLGHSKLVIQ